MLGDDGEGGVAWIRVLVYVVSLKKGGHGSVSLGVDR
jgi:hypothetical protein